MLEPPQDAWETPPPDDGDERAAVRARLDDLLGGRSDREVTLITGMVHRFPAKASDLLERWFESAVRGEQGEAARLVHTLRGAALNLGSLALSAACEQVETLHRDGAPAVPVAHRHLLEEAAADFARTLSSTAAELIP